MSIVKLPKPTPKMIDYMMLLFNETGFESIDQRNAWLTHQFNRSIKHLDELTISEGHKVIDRLKDIRESGK